MKATISLKTYTIPIYKKNVSTEAGSYKEGEFDYLQIY